MNALNKDHLSVLRCQNYLQFEIHIFRFTVTQYLHSVNTPLTRHILLFLLFTERRNEVLGAFSAKWINLGEKVSKWWETGFPWVRAKTLLQL